MVGPQLGTKEVGIGSKYRDPLDGPVDKTLPSDEGRAGLSAGWRAGSPHALQPKNQNRK